jgi:hypothetical protein
LITIIKFDPLQVHWEMARADLLEKRTRIRHEQTRTDKSGQKQTSKNAPELSLRGG